MKVRQIQWNNRRRSFTVRLGRKDYEFPYNRLEIRPEPGNPVVEGWIDEELGREAFSYRLKDGREGSVHADHVLEVNRDPGYLAELILYRLSVEAGRRIEQDGWSRRDLIRRLGTSPAQYYRLLDPTNKRKSLNQLLSLLQVLGCDVDVVVKGPRRVTQDP